MVRAIAAAAAFACLCGGVRRAQAQEKEKVIYFLSGIQDHGRSGGGRHEVAFDMQVLRDCIDHATNLKGVKITTKYLAARTNLDVEDLKGVDAVIVECSSISSTQNRTHPLFPPLPPAAPPPAPAATAPGENPPPAGARQGRGGQGGGRGPQRRYDQATLTYFDDLDALHKAGMGVMILHWGIYVNDLTDPKIRDIYLKWFGQTGLEGYSQNPLGYWKVTPIESGKSHPIMRGVGPWMYKDEIFSRLMVNPGDPYRTDLLMGESPETNQSEIGMPKGQITPRGIASAYEKGKERGLLWGGMDFHSALLNENYLRFVMNEILWVAGIDVPEGGVKTSTTKLQMAPLNHTYENTKRPEGYVEPKTPDAP